MYNNMWILTIYSKQKYDEYETQNYLYFLDEINAIIRMKELYIIEFNDKCYPDNTLSFDDIKMLFDNEIFERFYVDRDYSYDIEIAKIKYEDK